METENIFGRSGQQMGKFLNGVSRCPHCGIANPLLVGVWASDGPLPRGDGNKSYCWACYICTSCGSAITAKGEYLGSVFEVPAIFPSAKSAHEDIPEPARRFLQQAFDTIHAPDAAAVMAGSAVDAMLKYYKYEKGNLYERIDQALGDNLLTKGMADWAHEVRLGSNRPRHADKEKPNVSSDEAQQSVEFAEALGNFLFVLTARIERGLKAAGGKVPPKKILKPST